MEIVSVENAKRAILEYVEHVVMCGENPDGEPIREALFGRRDEETQQRLRSRLRREAELWGPGAPEWRAIPVGRDEGHVIYAGRLLQLYAEVRADREGNVYDTSFALD